jgi:transposase InsO family protein
MTDNGSCYKAFAFDRACKRLKLKHIRTRPYTPKTNGKARGCRRLAALARRIEQQSRIPSE